VSSGDAEEGAANLSPKVIRAIERERRRLDRATALLKCLTVASMYDDAIDAGGVAEVAYRLVEKAIGRLDVVELRRAAKRSRGPS
jgi:hypothetical protein